MGLVGMSWVGWSTGWFVGWSVCWLVSSHPSLVFALVLFLVCSRASSTCSLVPLLWWVGVMGLVGVGWVGYVVGLMRGWSVGSLVDW